MITVLLLYGTGVYTQGVAPAAVWPGSDVQVDGNVAAMLAAVFTFARSSGTLLKNKPDNERLQCVRRWNRRQIGEEERLFVASAAENG